MLRGAVPAALVAACLCLAPAVAAAAKTTWAEGGLAQPQKLTVALSDELLGQLGPDGRHLYFVSNRNATSQIFVQDLAAPNSTLLFDEGADVTWPRVSPDGRLLLYISFRDDASGQLCVRDLARLERRCLAGAGGALQALWIGNGEILLAGRGAREGDDLRLSRVRTDGSLRAAALFDRNLTAPALSPDGRWLAFVALDRTGERLGPAFAAQARRALVLRRFDAGGAAGEATVRFALPGTTGQAAFSPDGRWLYFTQYLSDTDESGVLDADDHGVIFRVPFAGEGDAPAALARATPEQLSSAAWNCQYPAPAASRLVLTCTRTGSLDLYALPPSGIVPEGWTSARLLDEAAATRDPWERLLLLSRRAGLEPAGPSRAALLPDVVRAQLALHEYESAAYYADAMVAAGTPSVAALGGVLGFLIAERAALRAFNRGLLGRRFLDELQARLAGVRAAPAGELPEAAALRRVVESEILDDMGDKDAAVGALAAAAVSPSTPALVVLMAAERVEALMRELDRPAALLDGLRPLVDHPSLPEQERLRLAGIYARSVVRGLAPGEAETARAKELAAAPPGSTRAFWLGLIGCLPHVTPGSSTGRACIHDLHEREQSLARRRALVDEVVRRAEETDAEDLEYELARVWEDDVAGDAAERSHAVRLYRHVVEDRAYEAFAAGRYREAAAEFEEVTRQIDSLESHVGYIEAMLKGEGDADPIGRADRIGRSYAERYPAGSPIRRFARAYLDTRRLQELDGSAFDRAAAAALVEVQAVERGLPQQAEVRALYGAILHLGFLRSGDLGAAEEANTHYLLALDLAGTNGRYRAMVLEQLALLHAAAGNHRIADAHFAARATLPFVEPELELSHHLLHARSLLHIGHEPQAAEQATRALGVLDRNQALRRFRPLSLDRAALYTLAAGDAGRAASLYEQAAAGPPPSQGTSDDAARNRVVLSLGHAAAALAAGKPDRALLDLDGVDRGLAGPETPRWLAWPGTPLEEVRMHYDLLRLGLRGQAERSLGRLSDAARSLGGRLALLIAQQKRRSVDEDLLALSLTEAQLADVARAQKDATAAAGYVSRSLAHADAYALRSGTPLTEGQLSALTFAGELLVVERVPLAAFDFDVVARLESAYDHLSATRDGPRLAWRGRLLACLALLLLDGTRLPSGTR